MFEFIDAMDHGEPTLIDPYGRRSGTNLDLSPTSRWHLETMGLDDITQLRQIGLNVCEGNVADGDLFALVRRERLKLRSRQLPLAHGNQERRAMIKRERQNAPGRTDRFGKEGGIFVGEWFVIGKAHQTQSLPSEAVAR